ncbi:MAG: copper homeostasis protein CutC [Spirochaetaceae bacterium]|nr:MAG: copper homeostasis protein CutC [Spirochaetaceae bacterium]
MNTRPLLEACCGSLSDVRIAAENGIDRVELNSAIFLGGLTPSYGTVCAAVEDCGIPVVVMIRPRPGGFCYDEEDYRCMLRDISEYRRIGIAGFVFGVLHRDGRVDYERNRALIEQAEGTPVVFHRAFDVVPDRFAALETLVDLGFERVLTTGGRADPRDALEHVAELVRTAGNRIGILLGGVSPRDVESVVAQTGVAELHVARWEETEDRSCTGNGEIHFGGALYPSEVSVDRLDGTWIRGFSR